MFTVNRLDTFIIKIYEFQILESVIAEALKTLFKTERI